MDRAAAPWIERSRTSRPISTARCVSKNWGAWQSLSPFTVQRLFKRAMGVSPLHYQRALRARQLRSALSREKP